MWVTSRTSRSPGPRRAFRFAAVYGKGDSVFTDLKTGVQGIFEERAHVPATAKRGCGSDADVAEGPDGQPMRVRKPKAPDDPLEIGH